MKILSKLLVVWRGLPEKAQITKLIDELPLSTFSLTDGIANIRKLQTNPKYVLQLRRCLL